MASNAVKQVHRIFVGNIPWTVSQQDLKKYFSEFGHVVAAKLIVDKKTGISKGYGFVTFTSKNIVNTVCSRQKLELEGHELNVAPTVQ
ncbi:probable glycine-rich RNA-binding protein 1 [Cephus cinctus]|uniref:Probable glycine-rich RNA-binding protein 1 n=1 Tax=Cephus cinctus TaxID=211228 RepID=A0AAJ7FF34_CEPCN|nr:probable glycine-rich RNA-binding protein 1 [Cephus cinctus]